MSVNNSITSGTIAIEDGTKAKEEFAPARKVKVELSFAVPEGQDGAAFMHGVARVCEAKVAALLGREVPAETKVAATAAAVEPKAETAAQKKKREAAAAKPAEKTKADLEAEALADIKAATDANKDDNALLEDEPEITAAGKAVVEDDLNDLLGETAPTPITDLELANAVQKKNAERKEADPNWAPAKIRDVISTYSGGKRVNDIPAAKRAEFLKKIEALK